MELLDQRDKQEKGKYVWLYEALIRTRMDMKMKIFIRKLGQNLWCLFILSTYLIQYFVFLLSLTINYRGPNGVPGLKGAGGEPGRIGPTGLQGLRGPAGRAG